MTRLQKTSRYIAVCIAMLLICVIIIFNDALPIYLSVLANHTLVITRGYSHLAQQAESELKMATLNKLII
jgi:hypothetical protein